MRREIQTHNGRQFMTATHVVGAEPGETRPHGKMFMVNYPMHGEPLTERQIEEVNRALDRNEKEVAAAVGFIDPYIVKLLGELGAELVNAKKVLDSVPARRPDPITTALVTLVEALENLR